MDLSEIVIDSTYKKMNIPAFLLSSENNGSISLTIKGLAVLAIVALLSHYQITVDNGQIVDIVNQIVALVGGAMTLYGAGRKVFNSYKPTV